MQLEELYHVIRRFLFEVVLFFFLQAILMFTIAVLIILYPILLNYLFGLGLVAMGIINVFLMARVGALFHKVGKVGKYLGK